MPVTHSGMTGMAPRHPAGAIPVLMPFVTIALAAIAGGVLRPLSSAGPGGWSTDKKSVPDAGESGNTL